MYYIQGLAQSRCKTYWIGFSKKPLMNTYYVQNPDLGEEEILASLLKSWKSRLWVPVTAVAGA